MEFLRRYLDQIIIIIIPITQADYLSFFQLQCYRRQDSQVQSIPHYKRETSQVQLQQVYLVLEIQEFDWRASLTLSAALVTYLHLKGLKENTTKWWIKLMQLSKMLQPTEMSLWWGTWCRYQTQEEQFQSSQLKNHNTNRVRCHFQGAVCWDKQLWIT